MNMNMLEEEVAARDRTRDKRGIHQAREIPPQLPKPSEHLVSGDMSPLFR